VTTGVSGGYGAVLFPRKSLPPGTGASTPLPPVVRKVVCRPVSGEGRTNAGCRRGRAFDQSAARSRRHRASAARGASKQLSHPFLDKVTTRAHDECMPSARFAEALKLAAELPEEERAELARELVRTLPEDLELEDDESGFSEEWQAEIRRRLRDEPRGEPLTFEQLRERVDKMISHGE
jgi:hypothetical protein